MNGNSLMFFSEPQGGVGPSATVGVQDYSNLDDLTALNLTAGVQNSDHSMVVQKNPRVAYSDNNSQPQ